MIHVMGSLVECLLIIGLSTILSIAGLVVVRKRFIIKSDPKQQVPEKIELTDPNLPINMSSLQDTIRNARKAGYLEKQRKHWFMGTTQQEYFCMLCNIGLLLFKKSRTRSASCGRGRSPA